MDASFEHTPVLLAEALEWLGPALEGEGPLIDCTLGAGGHTEAFLEAFPQLKVIGLDRDAQALKASADRLRPYGDRVELVRANFVEITDVARNLGYEQVGAILYDLGVSSPQLGRPDRGFGYRDGFALDMRMDQDVPRKASDIVNKYSEAELIDIFFRFGEERFARRIARAIVRRRQIEEFTDAGDLAGVVKLAIPAATRRTGPHPARRTFQALRIETNQELEALRGSLSGIAGLVRAGGRIAVMSYHSLEDRIVKLAFRDFAQGCICPRNVPFCVCHQVPKMKILTARAVGPSDAEVRMNPRSESVRMRVAEKLPVSA